MTHRCKIRQKKLVMSTQRAELLLYFLLMSPVIQTGFRASLFSYELRCSQGRENKTKSNWRILVIPKWVALISWRQSAHNQAPLGDINLSPIKDRAHRSWGWGGGGEGCYGATHWFKEVKTNQPRQTVKVGRFCSVEILVCTLRLSLCFLWKTPPNPACTDVLITCALIHHKQLLNSLFWCRRKLGWG